LPICVAPLKIFDNANLPRLYHREDRCERRPHHQESLRALAKRHDQLRAHLQNFVDADNVARRLKTLKGLSPYEFVYKAWTSDAQRFKLNPLQKMPGQNI
jgi:hypothetical protein